MRKKISAIILSIAIGAIGVYAQDATPTSSDAQLRNVAAGQKMKLKGVVVSKDDDSSIIVRDSVGVDTKVVMTSGTSIKNNATFGGDRFPASSIIRGLNVEIEGVGDSTGSLAASKVRFNKSNLLVAQSIDARVTPAEERLTAAEQNAQRVSGQIDELMAISNAARGGAKAAQDTADAAVAGVNATNKRISDLDDYVVQNTATVNFRVNSSILSADAKAQLDQLAAAAAQLKGYVIEVTGFASAEGSAAANKRLSERRAQAVKDYLIENHNIPLRRMSTSYGYGELQAVADNTTRDGRAQNRRVEIKLLVSRGINQNVEVKSANPDLQNNE